MVGGSDDIEHTWSSVMSIEYAQLRRVVLDYLRANPEDQVNLIGNNFAKAKAAQLGLSFDDADGLVVLEIFHELYREGVIVSGSKPNALNAMEWPFYRVTAYGREVLAAKDYVPHDPEGYLAQLSHDVPGIDGTIIRYLEEALGSFKGGHILAAAVMTGGAAEKAMLLLVEAFGDALVDPKEKQKYLTVIQKSWMISRKYEELWKRLREKLPTMPVELSDDLHVILDRVFDLVRTTRNAAGHPTGKVVDRNAVRANFILFPVYCRRLYVLMDWLGENSV